MLQNKAFLMADARRDSHSLRHYCPTVVVFQPAGLGLLVAGAQIQLTHGMADGEFGLSVNDIVYSYYSHYSHYGYRGDGRLEAKLNGSMKDKASPLSTLALASTR